jgi:hypothetical protein
MAEANAPQKLSTSAIAKGLNIPSQQLFSTLKDYGWIQKIEEGWKLTSKGEFEGGEYVHSKRYGRYIVWPESLAEHPLLQAMEDNRYLPATALGKLVGLSAREVNRVLSEIAWIRHGVQGWEVTPLGEKHGGVQLENESSGTFYVVWPQSIQQQTLLMKQLNITATLFDNTPEYTVDLFVQDNEYVALDGHHHTSTSHAQICHWLYMAGIAHACQRQLPVDEALVADFYLPAHQLYIECWDEEGSLAKRMRRKEIYQQNEFTVIDIEKQDLLNLDDVLTRSFRKLGIRVY